MCRYWLLKHLRTLIDADLFLITVPDDQIPQVASELSELNADRKVTALHTSGALSSDVLAPLREKGWHTGSIHPLMSVSAKSTTLRCEAHSGVSRVIEVRCVWGRRSFEISVARVFRFDPRTSRFTMLRR